MWPAGEPKPAAANLNFRARQTVPNLVIAKLGANGAVDVAVSCGRVHVIADAIGYFTT